MNRLQGCETIRKAGTHRLGAKTTVPTRDGMVSCTSATRRVRAERQLQERQSIGRKFSVVRRMGSDCRYLGQRVGIVQLSGTLQDDGQAAELPAAMPRVGGEGIGFEQETTRQLWEEVGFEPNTICDWSFVVWRRRTSQEERAYGGGPQVKCPAVWS